MKIKVNREDLDKIVGKLLRKDAKDIGSSKYSQHDDIAYWQDVYDAMNLLAKHYDP